MLKLFPLKCPSCGAGLEVDGSLRKFECGHCGNRYLLDKTVESMPEGERQRVDPITTVTEKTGHWFRVAEVDVMLNYTGLHRTEKERILYAEIAYENRTEIPLKYRHDQWVVFDKSGYTFEPAKDYDYRHLYAGDKIYLGMTRHLNPGMKLRGFLAFVLPESFAFEYLQFSAGYPGKTIEFHIGNSIHI